MNRVKTKLGKMTAALIVLMLVITSVQFSFALIGSAATYSFETIAAQSNFPVINISIQNGEAPDKYNKENSKNATFEITNAGEYNLSVGTKIDSTTGATVWPMTIKGRGNSTWDMNTLKKPYNIKFSSKTDILGMGKQKSYSLLANWVDTTFLRNYLSYKMGKLLNTNAMDCEIVELCINGTYEGLYLLTEKYGIGDTRIVTAGDGEDLNGDGEVTQFLVEADSRAVDNEEPNRFAGVTPGNSLNYNNTYFVVKEPDEEEITSESDWRFTYIRNLIQQADSAIVYGGNYEDYIDVDSFIDVYILQELTKNPDFGYGYQPCYSSTFMNIEEGGKIYFGTVWDFDIAMGRNDFSNQWAEGNRDTLSPTTFLHKNTKWVKELFTRPEFEQKVKERWTVIHSELEQYVNTTLPTMINLVRPSVTWDVNTWGSLTNRSSEWNYRTPLDYNGETAYVQNFLSKRFTFLNSQWIVSIPTVEITQSTNQMNVGDTVKFTATVSNGSSPVTWSSSNNGVLTVDASGNVTAVSAGTATITASLSNGKSDSCDVSVTNPSFIYSMFKVNSKDCYNSLFGKATAGCTTVLFGNRAYVSMREGALALGGTAIYKVEDGLEKVTIVLPEYSVEFILGSAQITLIGNNGATQVASLSADQKPLLLNQSIYLPARSLSTACGENRGYSVTYVSNNECGVGNYVLYVNAVPTSAQILSMIAEGANYLK